MFTLTKEFKFEAAHKLPHHDGKCARLHGHSWKLRVAAGGLTLKSGSAKAGMLTDFADIKAVVQPLVDGFLDHHYLNETTGLENPTSEELARWVYERLMSHPVFLNQAGLVYVEIEETCTSSCRYHL